MKEKRKFRFSEFIDTALQAVLLNLLFLICCLPVVTIGAALTALYAGLRAMIKKEPCYRAFFKTFRSSFVRATLAWIILLPLNALVLFNTATMIYYYETASALPLLVLSVVLSVILLGITTMVFLFYSRFECTLPQLVRHAGVLYLSYPIRGTVIALLTWAPVSLLFLAAVFVLVAPMLPVLLFFYFSVVSVAAIWLMNHPFAQFARETLGLDVPTVSDPSKEEE